MSSFAPKFLSPPITQGYIQRAGTLGFDEAEWAAILHRNDLYNISIVRLKDSLINGIPPHLRGRIWAFISKSEQLATHFSGEAYNRLTTQSGLGEISMILRDLHRTFPDQALFKEKEGVGQKGLLNILTAYAAYDAEVGYCQGMGFIVGMLLIHMESEEMAFWTFVQIMYDKNWRLVFKRGTPKLVSMLESLGRQIKKRHPEVHRHFAVEGVEMMVCFSQYFITLFMYDTPFDMAFRIMDLFLLEGEHVLFNLLLKMIMLKKEKILSISGQDIYSYLRSRLVRDCYDEYNVATLLTPASQVQEGTELLSL